jgi:hypothetical protein
LGDFWIRGGPELGAPYPTLRRSSSANPPCRRDIAGDGRSQGVLNKLDDDGKRLMQRALKIMNRRYRGKTNYREQEDLLNVPEKTLFSAIAAPFK